MTDRYVAIHEAEARRRKLPDYEEPAEGWYEDNGWALFECDDAGTPVRFVFCDQMEPEDAVLVRDLRPLVAELNRVASRASPPARETAADTRRAWLRNSLRSCAEHERKQAAHCRKAHRVEPYRSMSHEMADAHDEAAAVFERRLTAEDIR